MLYRKPKSGTFIKYLGVGKRLIQLRGPLSQKDFALTLQIPFRSYQRYERGESSPSMEIIQKIASRCGVTIEWLITGSDVPIQHTRPGQDVRNLIPNNFDRRRHFIISTDDLNIILDSDKHARLIRIFAEGDEEKIAVLNTLLLALDPGAEKTKPPKKGK